MDAGFTSDRHLPSLVLGGILRKKSSSLVIRKLQLPYGNFDCTMYVVDFPGATQLLLTAY